MRMLKKIGLRVESPITDTTLCTKINARHTQQRYGKPFKRVVDLFPSGAN